MANLTRFMQFSTFGIAMFAAVVAIYLAIVDNLFWLYWVAFGIILAERLLVQAKYLLAKFLVKQAEKQILSQLSQHLGQGQAPLYGPENPPK